MLHSHVPQIPIDSGDVLPAGSEGYKRVQLLKDRVVSAVPQVCIERARIITRVYKENEGLNILQKRALALQKILTEMSIFIMDDELFVGHMSSHHRSAPLFPEFAVDWIKDEIDTFYTRPQDKFYISPEVREEFLNEIYPYWHGRTLQDSILAYMNDEIRPLRFDSNLFALGIHEAGGFGHVLLDYEKVLRLGINGLKKLVSDELEKLDYSVPEHMERIEFYKACLTICDAVIAFAKRYSELAGKMAADCADEKRRQELELIAATCGKVPAEPADTFYEAMQSMWFVQIIPQIYDNGVSISPGRFDQYMFPYYSRDISSGELTKEKAQEYLEAFWVKFTEPIKLYDKDNCTYFAGFPMGQNLCVGGVDAYGRDATNDLSYRCLEAHRHMLLMQPNFAVRWSNKSPREFMVKTAEAMRLGNGMPQISNDDVFIPSLLRLGVSLKEAREYGIVGCIETAPLNTWGRYNGGYINLAKLVEFAVTNGKCLTSGVQASINTGNFADFTSFEQVLEAYRKQTEYCTKQLVIWNNIVDMVHARYMPIPFTSMLIDDCISKGLDVTKGGAKYNWTGPSGIGIANAGDALYAIKKVCFEDKLLTPAELLHAIETDFEGQEELAAFLWNKVPKYGNDNDYVDDMTKEATDIFLDELEKYDCYRHGPFVASLLPVSSYIAFGNTTGASADGRHSRKPIADGISPQNGADVNGPTASAKSVACVDHVRCANGIIYNQKYSPTSLADAEGINKFVDLVRTYFSIGGAQIQINVVSAEKLKDAKAHPEKYKGLVVRVAGYSAFFNELAPEIQDSIITRTEFSI